MRTWQVERRKRTRHLIEFGGLVVKAGIVELTGEQGEHVRSLWAENGNQAFGAERAHPMFTDREQREERARSRSQKCRLPACRSSHRDERFPEDCLCIARERSEQPTNFPPHAAFGTLRERQRIEFAREGSIPTGN